MANICHGDGTPDPCRNTIVHMLFEATGKTESSVRKRWALSLIRKHCKFLFVPFPSIHREEDIATRNALFSLCYDVSIPYYYFCLIQDCIHAHGRNRLTEIEMSRNTCMMPARTSSSCDYWKPSCMRYMSPRRIGKRKPPLTRHISFANGEMGV